MRLTGPIYEGDGLIHLWVTPKRVAGALPEAGKQSDGAKVLPSIELPSATELEAMERAARSLRARTVAGFVQALFDRIARWANRARQRELEGYLAKSSDLGDLERRMKHLERRAAHIG